jgi:mercuric ion transport protein
LGRTFETRATGKETPEMTHLLEKGNPARGEVIAAPPRRGAKVAKPSVLVGIARIFYAVLCTIFVACVLTQVFFAGMGAFGADWSWHVTFVHLFEPLPLLMLPVAFIGRLPWAMRLLPLALVVLIGAQYVLADVAVPTAALHPVNAVLILLLGLFMARRAWAAVRNRG